MFSCSEINIQLQYPVKCVTCDRALGDSYRKLLKSGIDHAEILKELGIREQCCMASLGVSCHRRYQQSLIKESCITDGNAPLVNVVDFSHAVKPPGARKLIKDTGEAIKVPVPIIFEEVIAKLSVS